MRELTKSMLRMSWALPLFGVKQMTHLMMPNGANQEKAAQALDAVSAAAQRELGGALDGLYATGDRLQRGAVDTAFGAMFLDMLNPARWMPGGGDCGSCGDDTGHMAPPPAHPTTPPPAAPSAPPSTSEPAAPPSTAPAGGGEQGWGPMASG